MDLFIGFLPGLACAALMFWCMRHMAMEYPDNEDRVAADAATKKDLAELREEVAVLRAERALSRQESLDG